MANLKIAQLRQTLESFAVLYENSGATAQADALRRFCSAMAPSDQMTVDDVMGALEKCGDLRSPRHSVSKEH
jgi:hypothetical protein